jgi:hypothetical protein
LIQFQLSTPKPDVSFLFYLAARSKRLWLYSRVRVACLRLIIRWTTKSTSLDTGN